MVLETYAVIAPRSWRKKISAIVIGAKHSPAPAAIPMTIRATKKLAYCVATAHQTAVIV